MGHSGGGDIIGDYPLAKMLKYNHYLLNEKSKESMSVVDKNVLLEILKGLSEEERVELLSNRHRLLTARIPSETPQEHQMKCHKNTK